MTTDLLAGVAWECASSTPGELDGPERLSDASLDWLPASVPGTAAGALRDAGRWIWGSDDEQLLDGRDWWFRGRFTGPAQTGRCELRSDGLATIADLWLNGVALIHSENMFVAHRVEVERLEPDNEIVMRFSALTPLLASRRPRPRWRSLSLRSQNLRWQRTTLLGRLPGWSRWAAPVGPWRPIELCEIGPGHQILECELQSRCDGRGGVVTVRALLRTSDPQPETARLCVGHEGALLDIAHEDGQLRVAGGLTIAEVERWWPHSHGRQPRYEVRLELDGEPLAIGTVGFRTVELDHANDGFTLNVNGAPIFCRGVCWVPPDVVSFAASPAVVRNSIRMARDAGINMLRVAGYSCYEDTHFWEACDELGVLVWQDCMLSGVDPPDDKAFIAELERELRHVLGALGGRPSLAILCGSSESYQQAAMLGLSAGGWRSRVLEETIPALLAALAPGVPYLLDPIRRRTAVSPERRGLPLLWGWRLHASTRRRQTGGCPFRRRMSRVRHAPGARDNRRDIRERPGRRPRPALESRRAT